MKQIIKIFFAVAFIFTSCTSSLIISSWKAPDTQQKKYRKILVLGLMLEKDHVLKEKMEEHIVGDLKALGYDAVCSCVEYNLTAFENMKEPEALQKLNGGGIDAVLTIVLLDKTKERYYVPNHVYYTPYNVYQNHWWGYYSTMYDRIYQSGYYTVDTKYFWESNFYDLASKELLYSVQTRSFDPSSAQSLAHEYGKLIVNDMIKKGLLPDPKANTPSGPM